MNNSQEFICDDRMYKPGGLFDQIRAMTEEEFKEFIKEVEKRENKEKVYHLVKRLGGIFIPKNKKGQVCTRKNYRNRLQDAGKCKVNVELMILIHLLDLVTE